MTFGFPACMEFQRLHCLIFLHKSQQPTIAWRTWCRHVCWLFTALLVRPRPIAQACLPPARRASRQPPGPLVCRPFPTFLPPCLLIRFFLFIMPRPCLGLTHLFKAMSPGSLLSFYSIDWAVFSLKFHFAETESFLWHMCIQTHKCTYAHVCIYPYLSPYSFTINFIPMSFLCLEGIWHDKQFKNG